MKTSIFALLLLAPCATAQTPTPTPCHPGTTAQVLNRSVCVGLVCQQVQAVGCSGTEAQAQAVATATALVDTAQAQAAVDLAAELPQFVTLLPQALGALAADELQRAADELQRQADVATLALPATNTIASLKAIMAHQLTREQHALAREQLRIRIQVRILRGFGASQRIPVGP